MAASPWELVAQYRTPQEFVAAAGGLEPRFVEGQRGLLMLDLHVEAAGWVEPMQALAGTIPGLRLVEPVRGEGNTLYFVFQKGLPQLAALAAFITALGIGLVVIVALISLYRFAEAATAVGGDVGKLLAAGAFLFLAPGFIRSIQGAQQNPHPPWRTDRSRALGGRARRNPIDGASVASMLGLGLVGYVGYRSAQEGTLPKGMQQWFHDLSPTSFPAPRPAPGAVEPRQSAPSTLPVGTPGGPTGGSTPCFLVPPSEVTLTFQLGPWDPPRQEGQVVIYSGSLSLEGDPIADQIIEFWDPAVCSAPFATARTGSGGAYWYERPLQPDELEGYQVFAYFRGARGLFGGKSPAASGIWTVRPQ